MLDCGCNVYSTNANFDVECGPVEKAQMPTAILGHTGVNVIDEQTTVHLPEVDLNRRATVSRFGPNMAPLGRLVYDDGFVVERWSREDGFIFSDPSGNLVKTHVDDYCPMLGDGPEFIPDAK